MSDKHIPTEPSESNDSSIEPVADADIVIDITNGKHVSFNLDPVEWVIFLGGISVIIYALGKSGLV